MFRYPKPQQLKIKVKARIMPSLSSQISARHQNEYMVIIS